MTIIVRLQLKASSKLVVVVEVVASSMYNKKLVDTHRDSTRGYAKGNSGEPSVEGGGEAK